MATTESSTVVNMVANADLSGDQFKLVQITGDNEVGLAAVGTRIMGVLCNKPGEATGAAGEAAAVAIDGISKVSIGAAVTAGDMVTSDANGQAIVATSTNYAIGMFLEAGAAADEVVSVLLKPQALLA